MRPHLLSLAIGSLAVLAGCAEQTPTGPRARPDLAPLASTSSVVEVTDPNSPWARIVNGETGPGALYAIYVPKNPNGDAVYYAHGFRDAPGVIDLRNQDDFFAIRDQLGHLRYTVAYSSYSENGFAVQDGAQRTHQLRGRVAAELGGQPNRSFIMGHSLGGGIGLYLAEKYPDQYDGALLMCGMVGGSLVQTQYVGNVRALVDLFFPGAFTGSVLTPPDGEITAAAVQAYFLPRLGSPDPVVRQGTAARILAIASTREAPLPFAAGPGNAFMFPTLVGSIAGALNFHSRGIANLLDITNGTTPFDNTARYSVGGALLPSAVLDPMIAAMNAGVPVYEIAPSAQNYLEHHFTPTGELRIPVVTLHNRWDPGVPAFHVAALAAAAGRANAMHNLEQRWIEFDPINRNALRHCDITAADAIPAFQALVERVSPSTAP
jgi:pimeloyl-ACP methyl ester carboxylesterase